ncbi:hypothetical protein [Candidatus Enterococcus leclercqii]|uniref:hypothetical protein n=1 Tax=Candidatus Enterococcus leclercqii TaxID=1857218 RepID=UPI00137A0C52|nr:hypothetical protein [Enterococcus sp. CU9D]KAF1294170.1 hypothetical protein BAU14_07215 [Enterococcus sp. CU9D]
MSKDFTPLINISNPISSSTLQSREVNISGSNDFTRKSANQMPDEKSSSGNLASNKKDLSKDQNADPRFKATTTQKLSPAVNLKISTLRPFLGEVEGLQKGTVNEIINLLVDNYVNTKISTRQQEAFNSMYQTQLDLLKK